MRKVGNVGRLGRIAVRRDLESQRVERDTEIAVFISAAAALVKFKFHILFLRPEIQGDH